jgi:hypothetical protein
MIRNVSRDPPLQRRQIGKLSAGSGSFYSEPMSEVVDDEREENDPDDDAQEPDADEPEEEEPEESFTAGYAFAGRLRVALTEFDNILAEAPEETDVSEIEAARDEISVLIDHLLPDIAPEGWEPA